MTMLSVMAGLLNIFHVFIRTQVVLVTNICAVQYRTHQSRLDPASYHCLSSWWTVFQTGRVRPSSSVGCSDGQQSIT